MEFQEAVVKFVVPKNIKTKWVFDTEEKGTEKTTEIATPKRRWKIFHRSSSPKPPPKEFLCPISKSLMADPVIVSSGHTFESACVQACKTLGFTPNLIMDSSTPDFSSVIPNLALKTTILKWCKNSYTDPPKPIDLKTANKLVRTLMAAQGQTPDAQKQCEPQKIVVSEKELLHGVRENPGMIFKHAATELIRRPTHFYSSSDESVGATTVPTPPLQLTTRPSCYSSSSSSEMEILNPDSTEEEEIVTKLKSPRVFEIEEALVSLRNVTRTREDTRARLCTPRVLSSLRSLIISRYSTIQVNSVAALVNLSLEKVNKVKIVRSGIVPPLIDVLKGGFPEAQEHASGALFSLALADENKTAIGVLGALQPLIFMLRSESERTRHDSALALYHLSLVQSNRTKLVKLGSVPFLLGMVRSGHMTGRVLLVLCNVALCDDGRAAMLDSGTIGCLVGLLRETELDSESTRESCVAVLYCLSHGGLRFKGLAKAAGAVEALIEVEKVGSERARDKARRILEMMKERDEKEEEVDWELVLGFGSPTPCRLGGGLGESSV